MSRNIITGIDIGSSTIRITVVEQKKDGGIHILSSAQKESQGIRRGYVVNFEEAVKSVRDAVKMAEKLSGITVKHAYIAIGGISLGAVRSKGMVMVSRADSEVTEYDVKRAIAQSETNLPNLANRRIIHTIPATFKLDGNMVLGRPIGMKGTRLEVETLFITCLSQHLSDFVKVIEAAGVAIDDVVASSLAASFIALNRQQKEAGCIMVNIGSGTVSIVVFEENIPISLEVFPIGSTHITNDIALGLQIPIEEAEKLKLEYTSSASLRRKLVDIIEARLNDIFELIENHLKKNNKNGLLPAGIILTGGGANLEAIEEIAKTSLKLPAKIGIYHPNGASESITVGAHKEHVLKNPEWSVALGLCVIGSKEDSETGIGIEAAGRTKNAILRWLKSFLP